jgi:hypothetical protein
MMGCISGGREERRRKSRGWMHGDNTSFLAVEERSTLVIGTALKEKGRERYGYIGMD